MPPAFLYFLFFCSGLSGLVYQVVWVREFGIVFGNTIYSSSIVVAIFMLGLGLGSYIAGIWADRRYASAPESLLRAYGYAELLIAALGLAVSLVLPHSAGRRASVLVCRRRGRLVRAVTTLVRGAERRSRSWCLGRSLCSWGHADAADSSSRSRGTSRPPAAGRSRCSTASTRWAPPRARS